VDLRAGENVIFRGHPSWRAVLGFYLKGLLIALAAGAIVGLVSLIAGGFSLASAILAAVVAFVVVVLVGFVKRIATTYSITNQRLHIRRGIVARKIQQTRIERVQNVNVSQTVLQRVLQVGTVDFDTAGTDDSEFAFVGVSQPEHVMEAVEQAQHEARTAPDGLGDEPAPRAASPPTAG
jgi:uncharacterized membrane protein YdbT with pleckstrin-like domain